MTANFAAEITSIEGQEKDETVKGRPGEDPGRHTPGGLESPGPLDWGPQKLLPEF